MPDETPSNTQLASMAADLAILGGSLAMRHFGRLDQLVFDEKADAHNAASNLVSEADREVENLLRDRLATERPFDGFAGEESEDPGESGSGLTWVIDPIDGTLNFAYGRIDWVVSVAVVDSEGVALAGAVLHPVLDRLYMAARGDGARLNGLPAHVNQPRDLGHTLVEIGHGRALSGYLPSLVEEFTPARGLRRCGSAALALCYLAGGLADAVYLPELKLWDYAAALLIAEEAGAFSEQFVVDDEPVLLATAPSVYDDFRAGVSKHIPLRAASTRP